MTINNILPFPIASSSTNSELDSLLGQVFEYQGLQAMLVKAAAALTTPGGRFLAWSDPSQDGNTVSGTASALSYAGAVAGLAPALLSGNVTSNAYLFVIRGGKETQGGDGNSVAVLSSGQAAAAGNPCVIITSGNLGVSSGADYSTVVAVTRQVTSSSTWLTTQASFCAEVEVLLA